MKIFKSKNMDFNELLKGSSISLLLKVLGMVLGYVAMLLATNLYGAEQWGIYSLCFTILSIAVILPKFGFDNSLVRIITELDVLKNDIEIKKVLKKALIISFLASVTIAFSINLFSDFISNDIIKQEGFSHYIELIGIAIFPASLLVILSAVFQALKQVALFMLFQTTLVNAIFLLLLFIGGITKSYPDLFTIYLYAIVTSAVVAILIIWAYLKNKKEKGDVLKKFTIKDIGRISIPMMLSSSFALLMGWSDTIMLSYYKTLVDVGIYSSILKLSTLSGVALVAINAIAVPKFVEYFAIGETGMLRNVVQKSTKMIFFSTVPILLIFIMFSKKILGFFGEEFVQGYFALTVLCLAGFINAISGSVGYIMQMTDQQKTYQNVIILAFVLNIFLNWVLIPKYGFNGAALASSFSMVFWNVSLVFFIKKRLGFWTIYIPFIIK